MSLKAQLLEKLIESLHSIPELSSKEEKSEKEPKGKIASILEVELAKHDHDDEEPCGLDCPAHKMKKEELEE